MKIGFYPGCSLKGTSREYNESVAALAKAFSLELEEVQDWNCCGATAAHSMNRTLALLLPARILALAEQQGLDEVVVPCASCYNRLSTVQYELAEDEALRNEIADTIRMPYTGSVRILNVVQMIEKYIQGELAARIVQPFDRQVACYYGCLLVRPHGVLQFDRLEDPQSLDALMKLVGAQPVDWGFKTECCGAGFSVSRTDIVGRLSGRSSATPPTGVLRRSSWPVRCAIRTSICAGRRSTATSGAGSMFRCCTLRRPSVWPSGSVPGSWASNAISFPSPSN